MRRFASLFLLVLLAACQAAPAVETSPAQPVRVAVSGSLTWIEPDLAECAASVGAAVQRADEAASDPDVITLRLGKFAGEGFAAILGEDHLAIVVNPDNPVSDLALETVQSIFSGREKTWTGSSEIQVWSLPQSSDATTAFTEAGFNIANAGLAPTPQDMLSVVADHPAAIGFLPAHWLDDSVRALRVAGLEVKLPILAITSQEPQGAARALLVCLQEKINP